MPSSTQPGTSREKGKKQTQRREDINRDNDRDATSKPSRPSTSTSSRKRAVEDSPAEVPLQTQDLAEVSCPQSLSEDAQIVLDAIVKGRKGLERRVTLYLLADGVEEQESEGKDLLFSVLRYGQQHMRNRPGWQELETHAQACHEPEADVATNPIIEELTARLRPAPAETHTNAPPVMATMEFKQRETLERHFYETEFCGDAHNALFRMLQRFEARIVRDWTQPSDSEGAVPGTVPHEDDAHAQEAGSNDLASGEPVNASATAAGADGPARIHAEVIEDGDHRHFYARCISIVQSSGMGKSRLLRQLGQVTGEHGDRQVYVFFLCFREDYEGSEACVPMADRMPRDFLNNPDSQPISAGWQAWSIKAHVLVHALLKGFLSVLDKPNGRAELADLCDPTTRYKRSVRSSFLYQITKNATRHYRDLVTPLLKISDPAEQLALFEATVTATAKMADDAARELRARLDEWFILAIDEASGICPKYLIDPDGIARAELAATRECLAIIARMYSKPEAPVGTTAQSTLPAGPRAARFWLALTDTNSSISTLVPPRSESPSARIESKTLRRIPPCCLISLQHLVEGPSAGEDLLRMTPLEASRDATLARTGRPLWQSLLATDPASALPAHLDPDDSWPREQDDPVRGQKVRSFASAEFVLEKLLGRPTDGANWTMNRNEYLALLLQRLDLVPMMSKHLTEPQRVYHTAFQKERVHHNLGVLLALPHDGQEVEVVTGNEPIVAKAAAGFFRANGKDRKGRVRIANCDGEDAIKVWRLAWQTFCALMPLVFPIEAGSLGEVNAQALFCIAHDMAARRLGFDSVPLYKTAYRGESAFVHVEDFMKKFMTQSLPADMLRDLGKDAWMNFQRFQRAASFDFDRRDLVKAFHFRTAIAAAKNQPRYDFIIPIYCGSLDKPFHPKHLTWAEVQVKTRKDNLSSKLEPHSIPHGDFIADDDPKDVTENSDFIPATPPILIWLQMSAPEPPKGQAQPIRVVEKKLKGQKAWSIELPLFDQRNHRVLNEVWPDYTFPQLLPDSKPLATHWATEMHEHSKRGLEEQAVFVRKRSRSMC